MGFDRTLESRRARTPLIRRAGRTVFPEGVAWCHRALLIDRENRVERTKRSVRAGKTRDDALERSTKRERERESSYACQGKYFLPDSLCPSVRAAGNYRARELNSMELVLRGEGTHAVVYVGNG